MLLAMYDGIYLHIWKYQLHTRKESYFEHNTHTIRAILFPLIVFLLFINDDSTSLIIGVSLVLLDLVILGIDAFSETDSREKIGGLPRWEYIIHLFSNSFHFSAIILVLATKISLSNSGIIINEFTEPSYSKEILDLVSMQAIPGAILMAFIHLFLSIPFGKKFWINKRHKISCC